MSTPEEMLSQLVNSINTLSNVVKTISNTLTTFSTQISALEEKITSMSSMHDQLNSITQEIGLLKQEISQVKTISDSLGILQTLPDIKKIIEEKFKHIEDIIKQTTTPTPKVVQPTQPTPEPTPETITQPTPEPVPQKPLVQPSPEILKEAPEKPAPEPQATTYVSPGIEQPEAEMKDIDLEIQRMENKFKHISQMISPQTSCQSIVSLLDDLRTELEQTVGMSPMLYELNSWIQKIRKMPEKDVLLPEVHSELIKKLDDWLSRVEAAMRRKLERGS